MDITLSSALKEQLREAIISGFSTSLITSLATNIQLRCNSNREIMEIEHIKDKKIFSSIFLTREDLEDGIEYNPSHSFTSTNEDNLDKIVQAIVVLLGKAGMHDSKTIKKVLVSKINC